MSITFTERETLWVERSYWVHECKVERTGEKTGVLTITLLAPEEVELGVNHVIHEDEVTVTTADPDEEQILKWRLACEAIIDHPELRSCGIRG